LDIVIVSDLGVSGVGSPISKIILHLASRFKPNKPHCGISEPESSEWLRAFDRLPNATVILHMVKFAKSISCSCIAATLAARLQMKRVSQCRHPCISSFASSR
jgi:hypothetical protein